MQRYLIIGSGIAGMTAAETIREHDPDGRITIVSDEETPFYNRIRLCDVISGELTPNELQGVDPSWYNDKQIDLKLGTRVEAIDAGGRKAMTSKGDTLEWDRLLIATGSSPYIPEIPGSEKNGVVALRSLRDAETLIQRAETANNVVIIGGGLLGLEAGSALLKRGKTVTVLECAQRILPNQIDATGAELLMGKMVTMGFQFRTGVMAQEITGDGNVTGVITSGGTVIPADLALISAGVRPQSQLATSIGVDTGSGIPVNTTMETPLQGIFAAGDCAVHNGTTHGIWATGIEQGRVAGLNMCGKISHYTDSPFATVLKVTGIYLGSAGDVDPDGTLESFTRHDKGVYKKMVYQNGALTGCQMVGGIEHFDTMRQMIFDGTPVDESSRENLEQQLIQEKKVRGDIKKYLCTVCGYIHEGDEPSTLCPQCGAPKEKFDGAAPVAPDASWSCTVCGYVHEGDAPPDACPQCMAPKARFKAQGGCTGGWADEHAVGVAQDAPEDVIDALRANFTGECTEVGMYLAMARQADREGYPEIARAYTRIAFEEAEHAATFAELLGEVVAPDTKTNVQKRVEAEHGACKGKKELATRAKALGLDAIHDTVHEMCKDEARHGLAFAGLLKRYFNT